MARLFNDGSSQYLQKESPPITAYPFAMACKFRVNDLTVLQNLMWVGSNSLQYYNCALFIHGLVAGDPTLVFSGKYALAANRDARTTIGPTVDIWHHAVGMWLSTSERHAYIDGGNKGSDYNAVGAMSNHNSCSIGCNRDTGIKYYMSGDIAEAAIWNLTDWGANDAEREANFEKAIASLAKGFSPLFFPLGLVSYWPLIRDDKDVLGGFNLTPYNAPTISAHPKIIHPISQLFLGRSAPVFPFTGSINATSGVSGPLSVTTKLQSFSDVSSSVSGSLSVDTELQSSLAATSSASGSLEGITFSFISSLAVVSSITGGLSVATELQAAIIASTIAIGYFNVQTELQGIVIGISNISGGLAPDFAGSLNSVSSLSGSLSFRVAGFFESLANSITTYFEALMVNHSYTARYPNDPRATPTSGLWLKLNIDFGSNFQKEIGINSFRNVGNLVVEIKSEVGLGTNNLLIVADIIATAFRAITVSSAVIFNVPRIVNVGRVGDNHQIDVICPFKYDYMS